jgi:hypothetical protein
MFNFRNIDELYTTITTQSSGAPTLVNTVNTFANVFDDRARLYATKILVPQLENKDTLPEATEFETFLKTLHGFMTQGLPPTKPTTSGEYPTIATLHFKHKHPRSMHKVVAECFANNLDKSTEEMAKALCDSNAEISFEMANKFFKVLQNVFNDESILLRETQKAYLSDHIDSPIINGARAYEKLAVACWENKLNADEKQAVENIVSLRADPLLLPEKMGQFSKKTMNKFRTCDTVDTDSFSTFLATVYLDLVAIRPFYKKNEDIAALLINIFLVATKQPTVLLSEIKDKKLEPLAALIKERLSEKPNMVAVKEVSALLEKARDKFNQTCQQTQERFPTFDVDTLISTGNIQTNDSKKFSAICTELDIAGIGTLETPLERLLFVQLAVYNHTAKDALKTLVSGKAAHAQGLFAASETPDLDGAFEDIKPEQSAPTEQQSSCVIS